MATDDRDGQERSLAGAYLRQAVEHLEAAGSADFLYPGFYREADSPTDVQSAVSRAHAFSKRLEALRSSILFAALAAEAYVNEFIAVFLDGRDYKAVERMSTVNKYVIGTRLALGVNLFERDAHPVKAIEELFKIRHKLVHPKPGYGPPGLLEVFEHEESEFTPRNAAMSICMVGAAAALMVDRSFPKKHFDFPAHVIWNEPKVFIDYAARVDTLPERTAPTERPDLLAVAMAKYQAMKLENKDPSNGPKGNFDAPTASQ